MYNHVQGVAGNKDGSTTRQVVSIEIDGPGRKREKGRTRKQTIGRACSFCFDDLHLFERLSTSFLFIKMRVAIVSYQVQNEAR